MSPEEFAHEFGPEFTRQQAPTIDSTPYGAQAQTQKPGLTKRGKAALGISIAVIAGGSLIGYQAHSANVAESEAKAQETALKVQALELAKLQEMNRANEASRKTQTSENKARQTSVNACINHDKSLVGKGFGSPSYRDVIDACQAQYTGSATLGTSDMQAAGASHPTTASSDGGGVNNGLLIGGGALFLILAYGFRSKARTTAA